MRFCKVIYVRYFPLTEAIYKDLYFEELLKNDIEVVYLDLTDLFYKKSKLSNGFEFNGIEKINSYKQLKKYLKAQDNSDTLFISIMTFEWRVFKLFRIFTKFNLNLGVFARGVFPSNSNSANKFSIIKFLKKINVENIKAFLGGKIAYLAKKYGFIKPYDYIFKAGEFGHFGIGLGAEIDFHKAKKIEVNTVDYDQFLLHSKSPPFQLNEFIVFLDQYLPYHPDSNYFNIKTVKPEPYFNEINSFFAKIELLTGKKVVIAAHPKAEKYHELNPYAGRQIFFNQSNDLVKNAFLVMTHASTAICFPICYKKKILLLLSDYLNERLPHFYYVAQSISEACGATIVKIDSEDAIDLSEKIELEKYNEFKYRDLTSEKTESQLSGDIFINFIKSVNEVA